MSDLDDDFFELNTTPERIDALVRELLWELKKAKPYNATRIGSERQLKYGLRQFLADIEASKA